MRNKKWHDVDSLTLCTMVSRRLQDYIILHHKEALQMPLQEYIHVVPHTLPKYMHPQQIPYSSTSNHRSCTIRSHMTPTCRSHATSLKVYKDYYVQITYNLHALYTLSMHKRTNWLSTLPLKIYKEVFLYPWKFPAVQLSSYMKYLCSSSSPEL